MPTGVLGHRGTSTRAAQSVNPFGTWSCKLHSGGSGDAACRVCAGLQLPLSACCCMRRMKAHANRQVACGSATGSSFGCALPPAPAALLQPQQCVELCRSALRGLGPLLPPLALSTLYFIVRAPPHLGTLARVMPWPGYSTGG